MVHLFFDKLINYRNQFFQKPNLSTLSVTSADTLGLRLMSLSRLITLAIGFALKTIDSSVDTSRDTYHLVTKFKYFV